MIERRRNRQTVRGASVPHLVGTGNSRENHVEMKRHRWTRMKELASRAASWLTSAGMMCALACSGCERSATTTPSADSTPTSRPPIVTENLPHVVEQSSIKRQRNSQAPREISIWDTNSAPTVALRSASAAHNATPPSTVLPGVAQGLLARLAKIDLSHGRISQEQAKEVNQLLQQLREQGSSAIPAIQEFLQRGEDVNFDALAGGGSVDFSSLRLGLVDALHEIGGPEAVAASAAALQGTTDPLEVALLALTLEQQAPGEYRQLELTAARNALTQALSGNWKGGDISPLFETFQALGDANDVSLLKQAVTKWNYYPTLALAGLPNGVGIPALIQLAQDPAISSLGSGDFALRPLAQAALQYPDAAGALVDDARQNRVPASAWPTVGASLAGTYIQYGNQLFGSTAPSLDWSATEINQRIALVNQLLAATSSPVARQSLQSALTSLSSRLSK